MRFFRLGCKPSFRFAFFRYESGMMLKINAGPDLKSFGIIFVFILTENGVIYGNHCRGW